MIIIFHVNFSKSILSPTHMVLGGFKGACEMRYTENSISREVCFKKITSQEVSFRVFSVIKRISGSQAEDLVCST